MNFIDSFCSNIKKVIALIALMLLLTLVILIFTHTSLGYFLVLLPITLLIIYLLHKIKKLDPENAFIYNSVLVILLFIFILFDLRKDIVLLGCFAYIIHLLMAYHLILKPPAITQQQEKNDIESDTINVTGSFITYDDTCPDDGEDYGPRRQRYLGTAYYRRKYLYQRQMVHQRKQRGMGGKRRLLSH